MRQTYDELIAFVTADEFKQAMVELDNLESYERPAFVLSVFLNKDELTRRGIYPPDGVLIQRSAFGDRRPTLFCVKKFLPKEYSDVWQNVNLTFDNSTGAGVISREPEIAWREPLPIAYQAEVMAQGRDLEDVRESELAAI